MHPWHAIYVQFGAFGEIVKSFQVDFKDDITEICAPMREVAFIRGGRSGRQMVPWLGPLILARWESDDAGLWHRINDTRGVAKIIGTWPPGEIPDSEVERFLDHIEEESVDHEIEITPPCEVGNEVRFTHLSGAFENQYGHCAWVDKGVVGIRVSLVGRDHILPVPYVFVEKTTTWGETHNYEAPQFGQRRRKIKV